MKTTKREFNLRTFLLAIAASCLALTAPSAIAADEDGGEGQGLLSTVEPEEGKEGDYEPTPAEIMPRAPYELLLDVTRTGEHYVAVGARGHILLSQDGKTWDQSPVPTRATLTSVDFADENHGWAVGHAASILATDDGGRSWELQMFEPAMEKPFLDVHFFDKNNGIAIGAYDLYYHTSDGGETWVEREERLSRGEWHLSAVTQLNDGTLLIAGETGLLSKSTDMGKTWELVASPYSGSFFGVEPFGEKGALVYGLRGNAYYTNDISRIETLPPDTDLGFQFKQPPTITGDEKDGDADEGDQEADDTGGEQKIEPEQEGAEESAQPGVWYKIDVAAKLTLLGGDTMEDGGYVLAGVNGVLWESDEPDATVQLLPSTQDGGLAEVAFTSDGNLIAVGENGAFLYKRNE